MDLQELRTTAILAYVDLKNEKFERLKVAVEQILQYFSKMREVDIKDHLPTTHALGRENRTWPDEAIPFTETDLLLENAPETEDRFIVIPNIL